MAEADLKSVLQRIGVDDQVQYFIFLPNAGSDFDISEFMLEANAVAQEVIGEYMWHQEPFILRLPTKEDVEKFESPIPPGAKYLFGTTKFGDNVEDEWFIVHILLHLTEKFPTIVVRYD